MPSTWRRRSLMSVGHAVLSTRERCPGTWEVDLVALEVDPAKSGGNIDRRNWPFCPGCSLLPSTGRSSWGYARPAASVFPVSRSWLPGCCYCRRRRRHRRTGRETIARAAPVTIHRLFYVHDCSKSTLIRDTDNPVRYIHHMTKSVGECCHFGQYVECYENNKIFLAKEVSNFLRWGIISHVLNDERGVMPVTAYRTWSEVSWPRMMSTRLS